MAKEELEPVEETEEQDAIDPVDPLKRDPGKEDERMPGLDPVVSPIPPE